MLVIRTRVGTATYLDAQKHNSQRITPASYPAPILAKQQERRPGIRDGEDEPYEINLTPFWNMLLGGLKCFQSQVMDN